jgi:hypothetical protein
MADLYSALDLGEMLNEGLVLDFEANNAITKGQAVKLVAVASDLPKVDVAGAGDMAIGVAMKTVAQGEKCSVAMAGAIIKVTGSGVITAGGAVKAGAAGVVVAGTRLTDGTIFASALQTFADGDTGLILVGGMA